MMSALASLGQPTSLWSEIVLFHPQVSKCRRLHGSRGAPRSARPAPVDTARERVRLRSGVDGTGKQKIPRRNMN
ncbi:hypothetical protein EVAR_11168_1 [Eumeta japonica]|uniref:Uncharacterized protein n=1 Tax=Eumeta variegata TaxID=151549 RepID=A0A4C1U4T7_EUMVA|nr:hypothetical protein EVAR_11168_1 [Eumeta japonica]